MRHAFFAIVVYPLMTLVISTQDGDDDKDWDKLAASAIEVRMKGALMTAARTEGREVVQLSDASVLSGGTKIVLDWQQSKALHDELLWWSLPRHPDLSRFVQAELTGTLVFKTRSEIRELRGLAAASEDVSDAPLIPVLLVDSVRVQLADWRTGQPTGHQHDRPRVFREKVDE